MSDQAQQQIGYLSGKIEGIETSVSDIKQNVNDLYNKADANHDALMTAINDASNHPCEKEAEIESIGDNLAALEKKTEPIIKAHEDKEGEDKEKKRDWREFIRDIAVGLILTGVGLLIGYVIG
jgi:predicted  nucleic acid-binding Zn-ribbon protein